jgi:hypothetical protein
MARLLREELLPHTQSSGEKPGRKIETKGGMHWNSPFFRPRPRMRVKFAALPWNACEWINTWFDFMVLAKPDGISRYPGSASTRVPEGLTTYNLLSSDGRLVIRHR